jgi:hypothetical protein
MTSAMPSAPTTNGMPPKGPPGRPACGPFGAEEVMTSAAATLTPRRWTCAVETTSTSEWKGTLTLTTYDK